MDEVLDKVPVTISSRAATRIAEILAGEPQGTMLRISITGGGCSGFSYSFTFDDTRADDDLLVQEGNAKLLIDGVSLEYMRGSEVDFTDDLIGQSFKIKNPLAKSSCGCGTSFSV